MTQRDEYVQKLKAQLDEWNAQVGRWEAKMREAQAGAQAEYQKQLEQVKSRREEAMYQLKLMQNASADAWVEMVRGADQAWKNMQEAFDRARSHFEKK